MSTRRTKNNNGRLSTNRTLWLAKKPLRETRLPSALRRTRAIISRELGLVIEHAFVEISLGIVRDCSVHGVLRRLTVRRIQEMGVLRRVRRRAVVSVTRMYIRCGSAVAGRERVANLERRDRGYTSFDRDLYPYGKKGL